MEFKCKRCGKCCGGLLYEFRDSYADGVWLFGV